MADLIVEEFRGNLCSHKSCRMFVCADFTRKMPARKGVTLVSSATGTHYSYLIRRAKGRPGENPQDIPWFVDLLMGPDRSDFHYIGFFKAGGDDPVANGPGKFIHTRKSRVSKDSPAFKAWDWFHRKVLVEGREPSQVNLEVWQEGRCGHCSRPLSVPESIERGVGPECLKKIQKGN